MGVTFNLDAMVHYYEADCKMEPDTSKEMAAKVLRRVEVSKAVRRLRSMMQLAKVKIDHGWEDWTSEQIEDHLRRLKKRRDRHPIYDTDSTDGSVLSVSHQSQQAEEALVTSRQINGLLTPVKRSITGTGGSLTGPRRRGRPNPASRAQRASWKDDHHLAQSSPPRPFLDFPGYSKRGRAALARMSPLKQTTTLSPAFDPLPMSARRNVIDSDDENQDPILQSLHFSPHHLDRIPSSPPPRTPSPGPRTADRQAASAALPTSPKMQQVSQQEDAGLLVFLANSPSTALRDRKRKRDMTPDNELPSSFLDTPNGKDMLNGHKSIWTPGPDLNIYDFVNATPSPGQLQLGASDRTPRFQQTPLMGPPAKKSNLSVTSPSFAVDAIATTTGLGMSFGPKLIS